MKVFKLVQELKLKDKASGEERVIAKDTEVVVYPQNHCLVGVTDIRFRIPWTTAHQYFNEVIEINDEVMGNAILDECVTVLGDPIEPDGKDHEGFPSVLIATGIC